ncbi:DUF3822 family protein [Flavobacteriaceae bacterium]|nr:DUF3822 family protein [Flavobacteriaceae bacterium]
MSKEQNLTNNHTKLSIQINLDGFSFCVYQQASAQYLHFGHKKFPNKASTPSNLLEAVKAVFETETVLQQTYDEVVLIHQNEMSTLVPQEYFDEDNLEAYLKNTVKTFENDFISFDELDTIKANTVYIPYVNVNNFIFDQFGTFTYLHANTVFIQNILQHFPSSEAPKMYINVYANNYQLVVVKEGKLLLSNHFSFTTKEDFAYYILFVADQLKLDTNVFELTLFGDINEQTDYYKLLYNYVRNVQVYNKLNTALANGIHTAPQAHFNLLYLHS